MKIYKKIFISFIVIVTIIGLVAFAFPVRNVPKPRPQNFSSESEKNYAASLAPISPVLDSSASSTPPASASLKPSETSFEEMSGFSDLGRESDLLGEMETGNFATSGIEEIFEELSP